jgi:hypothetical protein
MAAIDARRREHVKASNQGAHLTHLLHGPLNRSIRRCALQFLGLGLSYYANANH